MLKGTQCPKKWHQGWERECVGWEVWKYWEANNCFYGFDLFMEFADNKENIE